MRRRRIKVDGKKAYYHLMSRTVNGEALFGNREREVFRKMIWQVADFSGIRVVTYAVMKNHFHLLVEVPARVERVSDDELVRRFRRLYPKPSRWQPMTAEVLEIHLKEDGEEGKALRKGLLSRMHDVSWLMKTLKQRFSLWFNKSRDRFGPLWSERFKSVLVEGNRWALLTVAAYIDLNAVRAGVVRDPKDYRFCGYGEAVSRGVAAREGLSAVCDSLSSYRRTLFGAGSGKSQGKAAIPREDAVRVLEKERGELPIATVLRCRVRYFSDGWILGSSEFVREHLAQVRKGEVKAHPLDGAEWGGLAVARGIRTDRFG